MSTDVSLLSLRDGDNDFNNMFRAVIDSIYPVGIIVCFDRAQQLEIKFQWQSWERIEGRVLVGLDNSVNDFNTVGKAGGERSVQLTLEQIPAHRHDFTYKYNDDHDGGGAIADGGPEGSTRTKTTEFAGGNELGFTQYHENMPPYVVVGMYRRVS